MGGGASKPSPKVQPPPRAKPGAKSGQPLSVTESRTSAQPPPPPKQRVLLSKDDGGAVPTPKRPDAASIRVDGTHAQRPLPTTASQKREEKRRAAEEAKRLKEEQANTKKVAAEESKRAKKAAVDEAKRLKAEQAIAKKVATAAAGSPKVAPAPPTPSVNALNWEHTRSKRCDSNSRAASSALGRALQAARWRSSCTLHPVLSLCRPAWLRLSPLQSQSRCAATARRSAPSCTARRR